MRRNFIIVAPTFLNNVELQIGFNPEGSNNWDTHPKHMSYLCKVEKVTLLQFLQVTCIYPCSLLVGSLPDFQWPCKSTLASCASLCFKGHMSDCAICIFTYKWVLPSSAHKPTPLSKGHLTHSAVQNGRTVILILVETVKMIKSLCGCHLYNGNFAKDSLLSFSPYFVWIPVVKLHAGLHLIMTDYVII